MEQIPQFARHTMTQPKPVGTHPDASLVAGFIERSLTPRLRTEMLEHLAGCAQCRGLAFLATPQTAPAVEPQKTFQWQMPRFRYAFRWAAAGASAAIVAGAIWLANPIVANKTTPNSTSTVAMNTAPAAQVADQNADRVVASNPSALAPKSAVRRPSSSIGTEKITAEKPSTMEAVAAKTTAPVDLDRRSLYQTSLNASVTPGAVLPKAIAPVHPAMQFMVAGSGILYRSTDKGQSWQSVDSIQKNLTATAVFGATVLAGNSKGELFRSEDNGATWTPVSSWKTAGSIDKIEFHDAQNATVQTANGSWETSDSCLTWHKQ